ncbi:hypothetical protein BsWGS_11709 [Bradybaena similaris]
MDSDDLCDFETLEALVDYSDIDSAAGNVNDGQGQLDILASLVANDCDFGDTPEPAISVKLFNGDQKAETTAPKKHITLSTHKSCSLADEHKVNSSQHRCEKSATTKDIFKADHIPKRVLKSPNLLETGTIKTETLLEEMGRMQKKMLELQKMLEQQQATQQREIQHSGAQNSANNLVLEKKINLKHNAKASDTLPSSQTKESHKTESIVNGTCARGVFKLISDDDSLFSQSKTSSCAPQPVKKGMNPGNVPPSQTVAANCGLTKKDLFGDSDSDWEMDDEDKQTLSEAGKDMKKLLHSNQRNRSAHTREFSMSDSGHGKTHTWTRSHLEVESDVGRRNSLSITHIKQKDDKNTLQCKLSSNEQAKPTTNPSKSDQFIIEDFSKIRIINPLISSSLMKMRMEGRKMISISKMHLKLKTPDLQGDWVTIAVIVGKTDSKSSSTGKPYSIWRLSDLEDLDNVVSFFLFGEVHKHLWKTEIGTVIGVLNPSIMESMEKKNSEPAFTIKSPGQLMIMGRSKDLSWCIGTTKKGNKCGKFINKRLGEYCSYHVQAAYRKVSSTRLELHGSAAGARPKSFEQKIFSKDCAYMYGGQTFVPHTAGKSRKPVTLKKLQSVIMPSRVSTMSLHNIKPEQVDSKRSGKIQDDPDGIFMDMITVPSPGSMNLVAFLKNKEKNASTSSTSGSKLLHTSQVQSITANELLKQHQQLLQQKKAQKRKASDNLADFNVHTQKSLANNHQDLRQFTGTTASALSQVPVLAKGFYSGQNVSLDVSKRLISATDRAKVKAILTVKEKGGISQEDPNSVKKLVRDIEKIQKKIENSDSAEHSSQENTESFKQSSSHREPPQKKSRLLGNINLNSEEIKSIMKARSKHKGALSGAEAEREEAYFNELEKKEMLESKLQSVTSIEITVMTCKQCLYTAQSAKDSCKQDGHTLVPSKTKKRFFMCKKCKHRTYTIGGKFPTETCRKCGAQAFEKTSMYKEKAGPTLESEVLNIRGDEIKYLNSMSQKVYLQTVVDS